MGHSRSFADRAQAGRRLAEVLPELPADVLVLGMARGGVPVAAEVADSFGAPLDVLVVR
jgi:predicted phosphoribosyltransferase